MEKKTVLIVDDVIHVREMISYYLKKSIDVNCIEAENGKEALSIILIKKPDLVLLDLNMPVMDGIEVLKRVRKISNEKIQKIPIIMLTGISEKSEIMKAMHLGVEGYIVKPFSEGDVIAKIKKVLDKDETKEIIETVIKPKLDEVFGNIIADEFLSKATAAGMIGNSNKEKLKLIVESICCDQIFIEMWGTEKAMKQKNEWLDLLQ